MPSASLDSDEKYKKLLQLYQDLYSSKYKQQDKNNKSTCKLFDNIFDSLIWLTQSQDKNFLSKLNEPVSSYSFSNTNQPQINVLVTGSLYLVGLTLKVLNFKTD